MNQTDGSSEPNLPSSQRMEGGGRSIGGEKTIQTGVSSDCDYLIFEMWLLVSDIDSVSSITRVEVFV